MNKEINWYEEVKQDFTKNISDSYTLNLAMSILEDRKNLLNDNLDLQNNWNELKEFIEVAKQENKILRENTEHNDKVVELLKEENERLKIQISVREEVCSRIASNWNLLKRYCYEVGNDENTKLNGLNVLDKMQELEQGKDE